jgi:hypothetical protein
MSVDTSQITQTGFEKFVTITATKIGTFEGKVDRVFNDKIKKPVDSISELDLCNILNLLLSKVSLPGENTQTGQQLKKIREIAADVNSKITEVLLVTRKSATGKTGSEQIQKISEALEEAGINELINLTGGVLRGIPAVGKIGGTVVDIVAIVNEKKGIADIPIVEVQRVLNKVYDLQTVLQTVSNLDSAQDIASLLPLQKQIEKLQRIVNPARLLPTLRKILQFCRSLNQVGLQILRIISFLRSIVKVVAILIRVFKIVKTLLRTLPIPTAFTTVSVTNIFSEALVKANQEQEKAVKILKQVDILLGLMDSFITDFLKKLNYVISRLRIILLNLENCNQNIDNGLLRDLRETIEGLEQTRNKLNEFAESYNNIKVINPLTPRIQIPGYTITIEEEELVDQGKRLKRRRAIAYNTRNILVAQGPLTFATNTYVLLEELKLELLKKDGISEDTVISSEDQLLLSSLGGIFSIDTESVLEADQQNAVQDVAEVQRDISRFIEGLAGGAKLKKKVKKKVEEKLQRTRTTIQETTGSTQTPGVLNTMGSITQASTPDSRLLSESERTRLETYVRVNRGNQNPVIRNAVQRAVETLERDNINRNTYR